LHRGVRVYTLVLVMGEGGGRQRLMHSLVEGMGLCVLSVAEAVLVRRLVGGAFEAAEGVIVAALEGHGVVLVHLVEGVVELGRRPRRKN